MANFKQQFSYSQPNTVNAAGGLAYKRSDELELMGTTLSSFFGEPKYYSENLNYENSLESIAKRVDPEFLAGLAIYARNVFHMRSTPHLLTAILANRSDGKKFVRRTVNLICERPDDITEIFNAYMTYFGKPIPNSLKKAASDVMNKFSEHQIGKYIHKVDEPDSVSFQDIMNLCHPKAKDEEHEKIFNGIINNSIKTPFTWETELSLNGNTKESWEKLIESGSVGYMALLRNLRNILNANVSEKHQEKVLNKLFSPEEIKKSKQLPFRFYSAFDAIHDCEGFNTFKRKIVEGCEGAIRASIENIKPFGGKTLILVDCSGSMSCRVSARSEVTYFHNAILLGMIMQHLSEDADLWLFNDKIIDPEVNKHQPIIEKTQELYDYLGGGTYMYKPLGKIYSTRANYDRILILSDNEAYNEFSNGWYQEENTPNKILEKYRKKINPNVWMHTLDIAGYETSQFKPYNMNIHLFGWTEQIFEVMHYAEEGVETMVDKIRQYGETKLH